MQSRRVLAPQDAHIRSPSTPVAPFGSASPLLTPSVRVGATCTLRPPRLTGDAPARSSPSPPEHIACDAPLVADLIRLRAVPPPKLVFRGWRMPVEDWKAWVGDMAREDKFVQVWRAAGIEDAILNSTVHVRRARQTMLALVGFWCSSTSTFVFPWGEVGFTLEDAHVLGNLPVWGSPLQRLLTDEEERLRLRLVEVGETLRKLHKESGRKAGVTHSRWLNWFVRREGDDELRHLGFLTYWLSKSVLACEPLHEVPSAVFGIAARLSRGERIALAPAVTASIYSDLTAITKTLYACHCQGGKEGDVKIQVWAQFRLLQAWVWERFGALSPRVPNSIHRRSRVRLERWHGKRRRIKYSEAVEALCGFRSFAWRPYTDELANWVQPQWYAPEEKSIVVHRHSRTWVHDVLAIVSAAGLVGLARGETAAAGQYKPYRVSMQLGYDQAIPVSTDRLVTPWDSITMCPTGVELYIPATTRQCSTLQGYDGWWDEHARILRANWYELRKEMIKKRRSEGANWEDNPAGVCSQGDSNKKRRRKRRRINVANNEDNSKNVSTDGKVSKSRSPGDEQADAIASNEDVSTSVSEEDGGSTNTTRLPGDVRVENGAGNEESSENVCKDRNAKNGGLAGDVKVELDLNNEENSTSLSRDHNMKKTSVPGDVKMKDDVNSKDVSRDGNTEESMDISLENKSVRQGETNFVEKPTNSTRDSVIMVLDEETPDMMKNEQGEEMKPKDGEHGALKDALDKACFDDALADELEKLLSHGLQAELMPGGGSLLFNGGSERSTECDHRNATDAAIIGDHIVEEVVKKFPRFFDMIPQSPHYHGLLQSNVDDGIKKIVYTSLWYKLVELMQKAIRTTCQTRACEIMQLIKEASYLENLGFDVRHLIAWLNQPKQRLKEVELAKGDSKDAREGADEQPCWSNNSRTHASNLL